MVRLWGVRAIGRAGGRYAWRLFIPITHHHTVVSWTTRDVGSSGGLRYVDADADQYTHNHHHLLYGEEYARGTVVVVEGPFDVYAVGPGAVCTFGTAYTRQQVSRIAKFPRRVIAYDRFPREAQLRAEKLCDELSVLPGETYRVVFSGKDAGESPKKEIVKIRRRFLDE